MSHDDKYFMSVGYRVRHKYKRSRGNTQTCELCDCKRRWKRVGYEYLKAPIKRTTFKWSSLNPPRVLARPEPDE